MFNLFKKKPRANLPPFESLAAYANKDKYFVRVAQWFELDYNQSHIAITDPHGPRIITMDPWPEAIFLAATGQQTVKEFIEYMANSYSGAVPEGLDKCIIDELEKLVVEYRLIELSDSPKKLDPLYEKPVMKPKK